MSEKKRHSQTNVSINDKSQGSVATNLRCGKIFNSRVVANLSLSQAVKKAIQIGEHLTELQAKGGLHVDDS